MDPADDLPTISMGACYVRSVVTSLDFHPVNQEVLLVGTSSGGIFLWNGRGKPMVVSRNFKVDTGLERFSSTLQETLVAEYTASVTRAIWSPDGQLFGVAYSKSILKMFSFCNNKDISICYEIEAHSGSVNDLAFTYKNEKLRLITCGDDKQIKVWDGTQGHIISVLYHDKAVYSVLPDGTSEQFMYATDAGGKILYWTYNCLGEPSKYDAPDIELGSFCSRVAFSSDGKRLFYCGTDCGGVPDLVELDMQQVKVKRTYLGIDPISLACGIYQFDTAMNKYLAFRDNEQIKFWMMDNDEICQRIYIEKESPSVSPCLRFNSKGTLLAVSTSDDKIKIFANEKGRKHLLAPCGVFVADIFYPLKEAQCADNPSQICSLWIPDPEPPFPSKIARLLYIKRGDALLSLSCGGVLRVWRWPVNSRNPKGQATVYMPPVCDIDMFNAMNFERPVHCLTLSVSGDHVASSSGDKIKVFCLTKFEVDSELPAPSAVVTCLAFDPMHENRIVVGLENSSIDICLLKPPQIENVLTGHEKRVTCLAFTKSPNILVSCGAENWIRLWNMVDAIELDQKPLPCQKGQPSEESEPRLQFHHDLIRFLAVNEYALSIFHVQGLKIVAETYSDVPITGATYSCDCDLVYACFKDGGVGVFESDKLQLLRQINLSAYLPLIQRFGAYPTTIAASPFIQTQFAVAISMGGVIVIEASTSHSSEDVEMAAADGYLCDSD